MKNTEATTTNESVTVAEQGAPVAPEKGTPQKGATPKKGAPKGQKKAKGAKAKAAGTKVAAKAGKKTAKPANAKKQSVPRPESKGAKILEMIRRAKGATLAEILKATEWQAHSVRGFISTAGRKHAIKIESAKNDAGERVYTVGK